MHSVAKCIVVGLLPTLVICSSHGGGAPEPAPAPGPAPPPGSPGVPPLGNSLLDMIIKFLDEEGGSKAGEALMTAKNLLQNEKNMGEFEDLSEQQRMQVLDKYIKDHVSENLPPPAGNLDPMEALADVMEMYIENDEKMMEMANSGIASQLDLVAHNIMDGEDIDTIKANLKNAATVYMKMMGEKAPNPNQSLLYNIVNHLKVDPKDDMLQMMFKYLIKEATSEDQAFIASILLQWSHNWDVSEELMEMTNEMVEYVMTETDLSNERPRVVPLMLLQHYLIKHSVTDLEAITYFTVSWLLDLMTSESQELASELAYYITSMGNKPLEIPDEEEWKWNPPSFCRIETTSGQMLQERECPEDTMCSVGPVTVNMNNTDYRISLCALPMEYMMFHACDGKYMNNSVAFTQMCPAGSCNVGPFRIQSDGMDMNVQYCSDLTDTYYKEQTMLERACAVTDERNYAYMQRHCPEDYICALAPFNVQWTDGSTKYAVMCRKTPDWNYFEGLLDYFLGGPLPNNETANDQAFVEFLIWHVMESADRHHDNQDPDGVGLMVLDHMVDTMEDRTGTKGLQGKVLNILERKRKMENFEDRDRKMMHRIIMDYVGRMRQREGNEDNHESMSMGDSRESKHSSSKSMEDNTDITLQLLRMLLNNMQQGGNPQPGMADLILRHLKQHNELAERQDDTEDMLKSLEKHIKEKGSGEDSQQEVLMNMIMKMMEHDH